MKKILCMVTVLLSLLITHNTWFSYKGKITLDTNLPEQTTVVLQQRKNLNSDLQTTESKVDTSGRVNFNLTNNKISWFKIIVPENTTVLKTTFRGWKRHTVELNSENEYTGKILYTHIQLHWLHLIIIAILGWYLGWFLSYAYQNGIPTDSPKTSKILNIEFLRVVFTLGIVWCHFVPKLGIWNNSWLGVEFFFILSGFLLVLTFRPDRTTGNFIVQKWIKFIPLVIFGGMIASLFVQNIKINAFFEQLVFVADRFTFTGTYYNNPAWYIFVLFWVSLLYFYSLKSFKKETVNLWAAISSICAIAYVLKYNDGINGIVGGRLMRGIACIGVGYFLAQIYQKIKNRKIIHQKVYNLCEFGILVFAILNVFCKHLFLGRFVSCMAFSLLILMFVLRKGAISQFFEKPIWDKTARYCLAIYLTHWTWTYRVFPIYLEKYKEFFLQYPIVPITAVFVLAITLGVVAHHVVEIPATRILNKWLTNGKVQENKI